MGEAEGGTNDVRGSGPWDDEASRTGLDGGAFTLPPPAAAPPQTTANSWLTPGQVLAAPNGRRLRHLPPPRHVADAVPLDLDQLEAAAERARTRPVVAADHVGTAELLEAGRPADLPGPPPLSTLRPLPRPVASISTVDAPLGALPVPPVVRAVAPVTTPVVEEAAGGAESDGLAAELAAAVAAVPDTAPEPLPAAASPAAPEELPRLDIPTPPVARRRPGLLVGSLVAFAGVAIGTATLAQRGGDDARPVAAAVTTTATTAAPTTAASVPPTVAAPVTSEAPATVASSAVPASTVPITSAATTPDTTAAPPADSTQPSSPASVLGVTVLNRELLDALGKGVLPGGQPWPRATFTGGKLVVSGAVPNQVDAVNAMRAAAALTNSPDALVNQLVIDPSVPSVRYLLVKLFDNPIFDKGSTTVRKDSEGVFELWGKRLREEPGFSIVLVAHGDGTSTTLASARAKSALTRLLAAGGVAPEQVEAQWAAGPETGPRVDFAVPMG